MKPILAIDYGDKRTGFAKSDELLLIATPLEVFPTQPVDKLINHIIDLIAEYDIGLILLGVPYGTKTRITPQTEKVLKFEEILEKKINIPIIEFDEVYSTKSAIDKIHQIGKKYHQIKNKIDSYAAATFLQEFLDFHVNDQIKDLLKEE